MHVMYARYAFLHSPWFHLYETRMGSLSWYTDMCGCLFMQQNKRDHCACQWNGEGKFNMEWVSSPFNSFHYLARCTLHAGCMQHESLDLWLLQKSSINLVFCNIPSPFSSLFGIFDIFKIFQISVLRNTISNCGWPWLPNEQSKVQRNWQEALGPSSVKRPIFSFGTSQLWKPSSYLNHCFTFPHQLTTNIDYILF